MLPSPSNSYLQEIVVHDHVLPPGWKCRYDPATCKYTFIHEHLAASDQWKCGAHRGESRLSTPRSSPSRTSPTPLGRYPQVPFRARSEANASRINQQFPKVPTEHIEQLMKLYNNRENLVISALLSEGHSRSNFILDEALFYKIKAKFPNVEADVIRQSLIKNNNREHDTIVAILGQYYLFNTARYEYPEKPQMKLKYLKFQYPQVDETVLLDLLYNNDYDAREVVKYLTSLGYIASDIKVKYNKVSETAFVKEATEKLNTPRPTHLPLAPKYHHNLEEQEIIRRQLIERFPATNVALLNAALEATAFDIEMAQQFLLAMTPQDSEKYFARTLRSDKSKATVRVLISREVQTNELFQDLFGTPLPLGEPREIGENAVPQAEKGTCTREDGVIVKSIAKLAKGPMQARGPAAREELHRTPPPQGPSFTAKGPDAGLRRGPQRSCSQNKSQSKGPQKENRKGPIGRQVVRVKEHSDLNEDE